MSALPMGKANPYAYGGFGGYPTPQQPPQQSNVPGYINQGAKVGGQIIKNLMPAKGGFDAAGNFIGNSTVSGAGSAIGNVLGKVVPLAGAGLGAYGLIKGGSTPSNFLNGIGSGASIGTMFMPGIGTAIGAGIGALAGGIRSLFHGPSETEKVGRQMNDTAVSSINKLATPAQLQEAQSAVGHGWNTVEDPLSIIVMRDALKSRGMDPVQADKQAQAWKAGLYKGEGQGSVGIAQAASPIMKFLYGH